MVVSDLFLFKDADNDVSVLLEVPDRREHCCEISEGTLLEKFFRFDLLLTVESNLSGRAVTRRCVGRSELKRGYLALNL